MITCRECGTVNRSHARFCLLCGARLEASPAEVATADEGGLFHADGSLPAEETPVSIEETTERGNWLDIPQIGAGNEPGPLDEVEIGTEDPPAGEPIALLEPPAMELAEADRVPAENSRVESPRTWAEFSTGPNIAEDEPEAGDSTDTDLGETDRQDTAASPPLLPGSRLEDRYEIVELIHETANTLIYDALDFGRCSQCGYADSQVGDIFCANCGASLEEGRDIPHVRLCALHLEGEAVIQLEDEIEGRVERWFEADGRLYAILPLPIEEADEALSTISRGVRHIVGYSSDPGLQRELDEDAVLALTLAPTFEGRTVPSLGLYAVADGMGGHESGEIASRLAIEGLAETILKRLFLPELSGEPVLEETPAALLRETIQSINAQIFRLQNTTGSDLGTTLTAALLRDQVALIANVGDSRTYLWRDGQLTQITADHSLVAQLVEAGALAPDEIYTHPDKSAIYRSLGHAPEVEVDLFRQPLEPGDRLLLCCDGVWEMLRPDGLEEVLLTETDPQRACEEIVRRANLAGGEDNISSVIVQIEPIVANR